MATIKEQILDSLGTDLAAITGMATVRRGKQLPTNFRTYPVILYSDTGDTAAHLSVARVRRTMSVAIAGIDKMHDRATDDEKSVVATDMLGAIQTVVLSDLTRDGLAIDTVEESSDTSVSPTDPYITVLVRYRVTYDSSLTDPSASTA